MIPKNATLRIARPTDNLEEIGNQYRSGLGFRLIGEFKNHDGFDGIIIGHDLHPYHLEFTHHIGENVGRAPTLDHLLVFYIPSNAVWRTACLAMCEAGFREVSSYNPYWDKLGRTFEDIDGYRVVLQNA